jgi:hypothetical protein
MIVASLLTPLVEEPAHWNFPAHWPFAWLAIALLAGRVLLAWLPPGLIGGHGVRDLATTAATSLFLGILFAVGLDALPSQVRVACWIGVALLGVVRLATAPAAMVPRHEPPLERATWMARLLALAACALTGLAALHFIGERSMSTGGPGPGPMVFAAGAFAVLFLLDHALDVARCADWVRSCGMLLFAILLLVEPIPSAYGFGPCVPLVFTAAACTAVGWLRRGDKRALATTAIFFAGTWILDRGAWPMAVAGAAWLVVGSPSPSRVLATTWCAAALAAAFVMQGQLSGYSASSTGVSSSSLSGIAGVMFILIVAGRWKDMQLVRARQWNPSGAPRGHEDAILLRTAITALVLTMGVDTFEPNMRTADAIRPALLVFSLLSALALNRFARRAPARAVA